MYQTLRTGHVETVVQLVRKSRIHTVDMDEMDNIRN